jgi:beta-glucosidase
MAQGTFHFPRGFLWGTATSSHQVEGGNQNNTWAAWEQEPGRIKEGGQAGLACDWWGGRWREDFDRAVETGQNAHRLSLEWSRIQPAPDRWDEDALDHYREIVRGLVDRNMTPLVSLHHVTDPIWLSELGGWENEDIPTLFSAYVKKVVDALKEYVNLWVTINEPNIYVQGGYMGGGYPPGKNSLPLAFNVLANMVKAHAAAYHVIHQVQPTARVGIAHYYRGFEPARRWFGPDAWMANFLRSSFSQSFPLALVDGRFRFAFRSVSIPEAAGTQDYFGLNFYSADLVKFYPFLPGELFHRRFYPTDVESSEDGFIANIPDQFFKAIKWATRFKMPILITENGVNDSIDTLRPRYMIQHIHAAWRAVNFSWPIKGYFHWSLVDNFEWERGWSQRFGLWGLDVSNQVRIRRKSVDVYAAICEENGIASEMLENFAPELIEKLFPG